MILFNHTKTIYFYLLFFSSLQIFSFLNAKVIEVIKENDVAEIFESNNNVIIMGTMNHCSWCNQMKPYFNQLEEQYSSTIKFYSINGPQTKLQSFLYDFTLNGKHLSEKVIKHLKKQRALGANDSLHIPGYPVFLYLKHGKIIDIHIGGCPLEILEKFITKNHK